VRGLCGSSGDGRARGHSRLRIAELKRRMRVVEGIQAFVSRGRRGLASNVRIGWSLRSRRVRGHTRLCIAELKKRRQVRNGIQHAARSRH
jgi:hypothetical protein